MNELKKKATSKQTKKTNKAISQVYQQYRRKNNKKQNKQEKPPPIPAENRKEPPQNLSPNLEINETCPRGEVLGDSFR